ncbi:unnamed protein product [Mucor circinelloides]
MQDHRVLEKHKHFALLYHLSVFYLTRVIVDILLAILQAVVFEICIYFLMGLASDTGKFFILFVNLIAIPLCMNGFFCFLVCYLSQNFFPPNPLVLLLLFC